MKRYFFNILIFMMIVLPINAQTNEFDEAKTKTDEIRNKAIDFECASYFPSEWEKAEELYAEAGIEPSVSKYNLAEDAYNSIFELAIPLLVQAKEDEIMALRGKLKNAGADKLFPQYIEPADQTALEAYSQYEKTDYYSARDTANEALLMYQTLAEALEVWLIREDIIKGNFNEDDPVNFDLADETLSSAMNAYLEKNFPLAVEKAGEAAKIYNSILSDGWKKVTEIPPSKGEDDLAEAESELVPETIAEAEPEPETISEAEPETISEAEPEIISEAEPETIAEAEPETISEAEPETAAEAVAEAELELTPVEGDDIITLPATFKVRPWASSKDCFWNISALPEVYGDPHKWRVLYNANKSKLPNPDNPDLIEPDTVLDIQPIKGETRQGEWESGKKYEALR